MSAPTATQTKSHTRRDPFYGYGDISLHVEETVARLFPKYKKEGQVDSRVGPPIREWVAYMSYRTATETPTTLFALHLLRRLRLLTSTTSESVLTSPCLSSSHPLYLHALILISLDLATVYVLDNSYTNKSWMIASREIFTIDEMNEMELDILHALGWRLRGEGEQLDEILKEDEVEWKEEMENRRKAKEEKRIQMRIKMEVATTGLDAVEPSLMASPRTSVPEAGYCPIQHRDSFCLQQFRQQQQQQTSHHHLNQLSKALSIANKLGSIFHAPFSHHNDSSSFLSQSAGPKVDYPAAPYSFGVNHGGHRSSACSVH